MAPDIDYVAQREAFRALKKGLTAAIEGYRTTINDLEKKIDEARPRTLHGTTICTECDVISMQCVGHTSQGSSSKDVYTCEICHRQYEEGLSCL